VIAAVMGIWALALIVIAIWFPKHLVQAAIVCSVFEGAAIVNAGGLGVSPYYFTLMLIAAHCMFVRVNSDTFLGRSIGVRRIMACAVALLILGVGSALVMPRLFAGWAVLSPRLSADAKAPLEFSTSNIGQAVYLILNMMMLWYTVQTCRTTEAARGMIKAFIIAGIVVVGLAGYQLVSSLTGISFPDDVIYSNDGFVMQHGSAILGMPRICSTFTEPSSLAVFLVSFIAFLITGIESGHGGWRIVTLLLGSIAALILSTSSTAYVGLAAITAWAIWKYFVLPVWKGRGSIKAAMAIAVLIGGIASAFVLSDSLRELVQKTVFEKDQSASYEERSAADGYSMQLTEYTWGLGVGLGSNRASSFLPSMLSTLGVCGAGIFVALIVLLIHAPNLDRSAREMHRPLAAALIAVVGAKVISSPDMATPAMWAAMVALIAVRATAEESTLATQTSGRASSYLIRGNTGVV
jgi:hypothetical protein